MAQWDGGVPVDANGRQYEAVPAGSAAQPLGGTGATGDTLDGVWLFPADTTPGSVVVLDGAVAVWTWPAGITLTDARPIFAPLNLRSVQVGGWKVTTPADVAVLAWGLFT